MHFIHFHTYKSAFCLGYFELSVLITDDDAHILCNCVLRALTYTYLDCLLGVKMHAYGRKMAEI